MNKKKAPGMDPVTWSKSKNKEENLNNNDSNHGKTSKKSVHNHKPYAKGQRLEGMIFNGAGHWKNPAEKPFEQKVVNLSNTEEKMRDERTYEQAEVTEKYRNDILRVKKSGSNSGFLTAGSKKNPATIFVVVYTVLLLVLGFLVCKDLTGKIDKLDAKLTGLEKKINILTD